MLRRGRKFSFDVVVGDVAAFIIAENGPCHAGPCRAGPRRAHFDVIFVETGAWTVFNERVWTGVGR